MQAAKEIGAEVVFMDLPHHAQLEPRKDPSPEPAVQDKPPATHRIEIEQDRLIVESSFYQRLAAAAGYRSWDEAWDTLFESQLDALDHEHFRQELATFCAAARATSPQERLIADGTLKRERHMLRTIRDTLKARKCKPEHALVACGGFHLFLDRDDPEPPPAPPAGTVYTTLVPYSFFRISELSGYSAGNRAPQFYQTCWELGRKGKTEDLLVEHVIAVLKQGRKDGEPLSSADAISVCQHAEMLARLRGRTRPILDDIHDALVTCCCKGNPASEGVHLLKAIDAADIGNKIGRVTDALGRLPIVSDFYTQVDALQLDDLLGKEKRLNLRLDKRQPLAERRSVFLHRLRYLEVEVAAMTSAPSGDLASGKIFYEEWALRWGPKIEPALIEQNLFGDTIESACLARLQEELAKDELHAGRTCARLVKSIDMDLPDLIRQVEDACGKAIDSDSRFVSLSQALRSLLVIDRYAIFRNLPP